MSAPKSKSNPQKGTRKPKRGPGRPSPYAGKEMEISMAITEQLKKGVPLRQICRGEGMPEAQTVYDWMTADPQIATLFARARELGFDAIAEETLEIADDATNDYMEDRHGNKMLDAEHVQRSKLRIETRLKLLAKWCPKKYGEKVELEHSGRVDSNVTVLNEDRRRELVERRRKAIEFGHS